MGRGGVDWEALRPTSPSRGRSDRQVRVGVEAVAHLLGIHPSPSRTPTRRLAPPTSPQGGGAYGRASSLPRLLSHLAIAFDGEVGKQRPGPRHLDLVLRRGFPDVAGVLALPGGDAAPMHRATSVRARTSGLITQPRHRQHDRSGAAALPDTRCAPGSREGGVGIMREVRGVGMKWGGIFGGIEGNQWVGGRVCPRFLPASSSSGLTRGSMP